MNIKSPLKRYSVFGLSNRWRQRIPQFTDLKGKRSMHVLQVEWGKFPPGAEPT